MFGLDTLEVAIGLIFLYLLLSLLTSALNELFQAWLKWRAVDLEKGIRQLLNDHLAQKLYSHPLIDSLFSGDYVSPSGLKRWTGLTKLPSYIPARNFALALMSIISNTAAPGAGIATPNPPGTPAAPSALSASTLPQDNAPTVEAFRQAIGTLGDERVRQALLALVDVSEGDLLKVRANIEGWFDSTMDRIAGWYKRQIQWMLFGLGLVISIAVNADTFAISRSLANDDDLRSTMLVAAQEFAKVNPEDSPDDPAQRVKEIYTAIEGLGLPLGWSQPLTNTANIQVLPLGASQQLADRRVPAASDIEGWTLKAIGWLLTATAITFGAPFWFDLLNKFIVVRSTVKPHEKSPEEPSKDK